MALDFRYAGRDIHGRLFKGTISAADTAEAVTLLRNRDVWVTDIRPVSYFAAFGRGAAVSARQLGWFCRQLGALMRAGLAPGNAIGILGRQVSDRELRRTLGSVSARLDEGSGLAAAFRAHPRVFSELFCSMTEAGELGGSLTPVMERLGAYYERQYAFRSKLIAALTYPTLILAVSAVVLIVLMVYILPSFHGMLTTLNASIPVSTAMVFAAGHFLQEYFTLLFAALLTLAVLGWWAFRGPVRPRVEAVLFRLPVIGKLYLSATMSGMCRTLGGLIAGGVPILKALEVVEQMAGNGALAPVLFRARNRVAEGAEWGAVFHNEPVIPGIVSELLSVGESTGEPGPLLERAADYFDQETEADIARITTLLEPLLILGIGMLVGLILLSVLLPMFDVVWSIQ